MQCNIDDHGARLRLTWGIMVLITGGILAGLALWSNLWWLWIIVAACLIGGGFAIFEARNKWCALRAMGIKTPH